MEGADCSGHALSPVGIGASIQEEHAQSSVEPDATWEP